MDSEGRDTDAGNKGSACPGGDLAIADELKCVLNEDNELVSSIATSRSSECQKAVGAYCLDGYAGIGAGACQTCCKANAQRPDGTVCETSWYMQTTDNQCHMCDSSNGAFIVACGIYHKRFQAPLPVIYAIPISCGFLQGGVCGNGRLPGTIIGLMFAPFVLKGAEAMKHAGALQAPVMSLINFFQSADLFKNLNLHWPPQFKAFIHKVCSW